MYSRIFRRSYRCFIGFLGRLSTFRKGCLGFRTASLITSIVLVIARCPLSRIEQRDLCQGRSLWCPTVHGFGNRSFNHFKYTTSPKKFHSNSLRKNPDLHSPWVRAETSFIPAFSYVRATSANSFSRMPAIARPPCNSSRLTIRSRS